ncbi:hypothetical protein [Thermoactinomyces sp. DSM 45892]|uniref:hypothetical protein n=1 Tax=Thermoactinomyces sp. DSM 45892 TaxID=1882753 RepID=UPI000898F3B2|nr:hypothetical protein [Thermoactinomyces sp. DSM 45892]SDZ23530.1 hypothetical protein SAMN05444416_11723 [Thermoactinomyces sp. DSM 45892]
MKLFVDFHGVYDSNKGNCKYVVSKLPLDFQSSLELNQFVMKTVKLVKDDLLEAKKQGYGITLGLPDSPIGACAIVEAVKGIIGYTPYVLFSYEPTWCELDLEEIREESRDLFRR